MLRRFALTIFFLFLLIAGVLVSLMPLVLFQSKLDASTWAMAVCLWLASVMLALLVLTNMLLRQRLLEVNDMDCPVTAQGKHKNKKIVFTWRIKELRWCELFSRLGKDRLDELHCRIDADTRTVYLSDRVRVADFIICPARVKTSRHRIPLPLLRASSKRLDAIEQYAAQAAHDYAFHPREIKSPVQGTILASGWHVRYTLF